MPNPQTDGYAPPTTANQYRASVPISVYRELAAELQATQAMMDSLNAQNQQLVQQNQKLRQEVAKVLQSTENLQKVFTSLDSANQVSGEVPSSRTVRQPEPRPPAPAPQPRSKSSFPQDEFTPPRQPQEPPRSPYKETLVIEQEERRPRRTHQSEGVSEVSGWWLIVAILLIVLTAFGTGFLIVRPLLNSDSNSSR